MEQAVLEEEAAVEGDFYEVDESLTPLQAVLQYSRSEHAPQRHAYIRAIGSGLPSEFTSRPRRVVVWYGEGGVLEVDQNDNSESDLAALLELVSELLGCTHFVEEGDLDTHLLCLEQLHALGTRIQEVCSEKDCTARLHSLCSTCLSLIHGDGPSLIHSLAADEQAVVVSQVIKSYAALIGLLPLQQAVQRMVTDAQSLLEVSTSQSDSLAVLLLGEAAGNLTAGLHTHDQATRSDGDPESKPSTIHNLKLDSQLSDELQSLLVDQLLPRVLDDNADDSVQKALLKYQHHIALLLPVSARGDRFLIPICQQLARNGLWNVRAATANSIPDAIAALNSPSTKPHLTQVPQQAEGDIDDSLHLTQTAGTASNIAQVTQLMVQQLCELLYDSLGNDVSHWVVSAAIQAAGPTVCNLPQSMSLPDKLLQLYCRCVGGVRPQPPEVLHAAARSFTAVVLKAMQLQKSETCEGAPTQVATEPHITHEVDQLLSVFKSLLSTGDSECTALLVQQLPELAPILGPDITEAQLLAEIYKLKGEHLQQACQVLVPSLATLVHSLRPAALPQLLDCTCHAASKETLRASSHDGSLSPTADSKWCGSWRSRQALAKGQSSLASSLIARADTSPLLSTHLLPLAASLCRDAVWVVRHEASQQLGQILGLLLADKQQGSGSNQQSSTDEAGLRKVTEQIVQEISALAGYNKDESIPNAVNEVQVVRVTDLQVFASACRGFLEYKPCMIPQQLHGQLISMLQQFDEELGKTGHHCEAQAIGTQLAGELQQAV